MHDCLYDKYSFGKGGCYLFIALVVSRLTQSRDEAATFANAFGYYSPSQTNGKKDAISELFDGYKYHK